MDILSFNLKILILKIHIYYANQNPHCCFSFYLLWFSCDNCDNYFTRNYIFESDQNQLKKTYQVGEDILLPVEFSAIMGCENNIVYDNSNGDFSFSFQLLRIRDNNQDVTDGLRYFEITDSTLSFIASHSVFNERYSRAIDTNL
jgi:hypothetical protein